MPHDRSSLIGLPSQSHRISESVPSDFRVICLTRGHLPHPAAPQSRAGRHSPAAPPTTPGTEPHSTARPGGRFRPPADWISESANAVCLCRTARRHPPIPRMGHQAFPRGATGYSPEERWIAAALAILMTGYREVAGAEARTAGAPSAYPTASTEPGGSHPPPRSVMAVTAIEYYEPPTASIQHHAVTTRNASVYICTPSVYTTP